MADDGSTLICDQLAWLRDDCLSIGGANGGIFASKPHFHNTVKGNLASFAPEYSTANLTEKQALAISPKPDLLQGPWGVARAFDWTFPEAQTKVFVRINLYSQRLLSASQARDPRLKGLYEWFGTRDGANIGYNVYKDRPSSSDDTHDWHIHLSFVTRWILDWAAVKGVSSVLRGETLSAYLARGGKLIGQGQQGTGEVDMYPVMIFGQRSQLVAKVRFDLNKMFPGYGVSDLFDQPLLDTLTSMGVCQRGQLFEGQEMSAFEWAVAEFIAAKAGTGPGPAPDHTHPHTHTFDPVASQSGPAQPA